MLFIMDMNPAHLGGDIRLYHESMDRIDKSVPVVTVLHHEALPSDVKQCPEGHICLSFPQAHVGFIFLHFLGANA